MHLEESKILINKKSNDYSKNINEDLDKLFDSFEIFLDKLIIKTEKVANHDTKLKRANINPNLKNNIFNKRFLNNIKKLKNKNKSFFYNGDLIAFGNTQNNLREIKFFGDLLKDNGIELKSYLFDKYNKITTDEFDKEISLTLLNFDHLKNNIWLLKKIKNILKKYEKILIFLENQKRNNKRTFIFIKLISLIHGILLLAFEAIASISISL